MPRQLYTLKLFMIITCLSQLGRAQERLGIANSNYFSTNSIFLNPAASVDSKTYMQFHIVGLNAFAMSNMVYLQRFAVYRLAKSDGINLQYHNPKLPKYAYINAEVDGPAFVISKRNYGAGLFVRARSVSGIRAGTFDVLGAIQAGQNGPVPNTYVNTRNIRASSMSWIEYGANFGMIVKRYRRALLSVAGNLRYLSGLNLEYANITRLKGFYNDSLMSVDNMSGKLRYTNGFALGAGRGIGADIGFTYRKMLDEVQNYYSHSVRGNCKTIDYKYKIGLNLRDLGYVRFKKNTNSANANASGIYRFKGGDTTKFETLLNTSISNKPILASLPTALVAQFDWNFENRIYLNATFIKNAIPSRLTGAQGPNLFSICPRYESWNFEAALPITFQQYVYPQLGLALRYRSFVLGADNIFPFIFPKNTYGVNIYFSLAFSIFRNPACNQRARVIDACPPKGRVGKAERRVRYKKGRLVD